MNTGHVIDEGADIERTLYRHIAGSLVPPTTSPPNYGDLRHLNPVVRAQGNTQSCVWQAACDAMYMRGQIEKAAGINDGIPFPSILQAWVYAQLQYQMEIGWDIRIRKAINQGSSVHSGLTALRLHGIASDALWPLDTDNPAFELPIDVDTAAIDALLTGDYGASDSNYPTVARMALAHGYFPIQAMDICDKFEQLYGGDAAYNGLEGRPVVARHMMLAVAWRPGYLLYKNSWGPDWGDAGYVWIADSYTSSTHTYDGAVITAAPPIR